MEELAPEEKVKLIMSQLDETLRKDLINQVVVTEQRPLKIYWGEFSRVLGGAAGVYCAKLTRR